MLRTHADKVEFLGSWKFVNDPITGRLYQFTCPVCNCITPFTEEYFRHFSEIKRTKVCSNCGYPGPERYRFGRYSKEKGVTFNSKRKEIK